ncbi:hypothetical protein [Desulfobotulus mexicanus]|uniref:Uncharacterized protein n=1 Tax=Desulfobotulus mexicanus TaxID=2586642 RepID=A0A5S5MC14_9BACT|nr:hypothetical protein [Desulfobotulus mexicanus]TYT73252.1 hypothetical protein FIM25_16060 [Desulfobotulus mexicanus]
MMDVQAFLRAAVRPRTRRLPAPQGLHIFFEDPAEAEFEVRGLNGEELARVRSTVERNRDMTAIVEKIFGDREEKVSAIRELMGLDSETLPDDLARRMAIISGGCMSPELDEQAAAKLFLVLPVFGYTLSDTILQLTGEGAELGE